MFTRVVTKESGTVPQSSFMIDLSQVASMLRLATSRSLLIIDEFGKGTLAADGIGLLCGSLSYLANGSTQPPPRVLLATHFTEVLNTKYLARNEYLSFYTMAVALGEQDDEPDGEEPVTVINTTPSSSTNNLVFFYRLTPGHVGPSFGVHCASLAGVSGDVIQRADEIIKFLSDGKPIKRKEYAAIVEKTATFRDIVSQLLRLDCEDVEQVKKLLQEAAQAAA
jgi:DNA mismatch repair protein MSH5